MSEINKNLNLKNPNYLQKEEKFTTPVNDAKNNLNSEENPNSKLKILNIKEEIKRYTKPAIVRLEYKTRYNSSKKVTKNIINNI